MDQDSFTQNILGVQDLVESGTNKVNSSGESGEGVVGDYTEILDLPMPDEDLLELRREWLQKAEPYDSAIKSRQVKNKLYYAGRQRASETQQYTVIASNLIFEAEETFIPQALSKNPEPTVWSDNTPAGKQASNNLKTMLQYHADVLCLRKKLGVMVRHWSIYFTAVVKHGWESKEIGGKDVGDITTDIRKPQNFLLDPTGYIDEYGCFIGDFLGERIDCTAQKLMELFPDHREYILIKANGKLGTKLQYTEWWTDEYCFSTFEDVVLDKHKNEFFNYEGSSSQSATPTINHFASPKMPYTFLSVFSLQETPHDITNLIEQSIPNQNRISDRDDQIDRNLRSGNNSIALSGIAFTSETARQAAAALEDGVPVLVPNGQVEQAIKRIPANDIPSGVFTSQQTDKDTLRSVFGTQGLSAQQADENTTARGMILNQSHDSTRIGGGIGDALEQVADNIFNWWVQLYCVYYDETHYGAIMGTGRAVEYAQLINSDLERKFVVSVSPNSMQPKDEISEANQAIQLAEGGWLDPLSLFKQLNYPDPMETAKAVTLFRVNPQLYLQQYFPEQAAPGLGARNPEAPIPPQPGSPPQSLSQEPANASLSTVPLPQ